VSYLVRPRLHFAGTFTGDVSTENNYVSHFKNPSDPNDPGWNPSGTGSWGITSCKVTSAVFADGAVARSPADDPVVGAIISQIGRARLVDLDPEQQMVSQIWGMRLTLASAAGRNWPSAKTTSQGLPNGLLSSAGAAAWRSDCIALLPTTETIVSVVEHNRLFVADQQRF